MAAYHSAMETTESPRCQHISQLQFSRPGGAIGSHPISCGAIATHQVEDRGIAYLCADHLVDALSATGGAWKVIRLAAPLGEDLDVVLTAAGAPVALDRLQENHATIASRVKLIAGQRDRLVSALAWLDADPDRLLQVRAEIDRQRGFAMEYAKRDTVLPKNPESYAEMHTPRVGQAIAELMNPDPMSMASMHSRWIQRQQVSAPSE